MPIAAISGIENFGKFNKVGKPGKIIRHVFNSDGGLDAWKRYICGDFNRYSMSAKIKREFGAKGERIRTSEITIGNPDDISMPYAVHKKTIITSEFSSKVNITNTLYSSGDCLSRRVVAEDSGKYWLYHGNMEEPLIKVEGYRPNAGKFLIGHTKEAFQSLTGSV